ncbi:diketogulonate reductase-like aldo/keto reductase [Natranaerovirga hydrolytica]|uniref:Diketogulonate reductase-like aldo/keto reductase n=1 Tax=Natranaerovirga hydrolytica TaxID=680378 RepID=A0A4R1MLB5_9FIRM|nr:aldo/keto reductase [Natranaerovirga hydrolytica]TCK93305.1 diketogulonate reductase-like aldo/keto reductase [Natranaerovirga hydrolytica]
MSLSNDLKTIKEACQRLNVTLSNGMKMPRLGQGTWYMGDSASDREEEIQAIRTGIDLGMNLIDTAEMYGEGRSESLIGEAIKGISREELFMVSKVYPHNASRSRIFNSCKNTLQRLGVDCLDLYLLHWRGSVPLEETVECMEELVQEGLIKSWGVSNFDTDDMKELWEVPKGNHCVVNQVLYHLGSRGIEYDLLPWMKAHNVPLMAYCPIAQGGNLRKEMLKNQAVMDIAKKYDMTPVQVLLSFVLHQENAIAIPKAGKKEHVKENAQTALIQLGKSELDRLSRAFPAPDYKTMLDVR